MSQFAAWFAVVERYALWIGAVAAGVAGLLYLLRQAGRAWLRTWRGGRRAVKTVHQLGAALLGDEETGKLGMDERVVRIEEQLQPNGGGSMRDVVNDTRSQVEALRTEVAAVRQELADHKAEHARQPLTLNVNTGVPANQP